MTKKRLTAYGKDIRRSIWKGRKRFFAIALISMLGVMMFSGLAASCHDLRHSADSFFDQQNLHDLLIVSTMGLTDDDVQALSEVDGVLQAEGTYSETLSAEAGENTTEVSVQTLSETGMDEPLLLSGRMPESTGECAVTTKFLRDNSLQLGDTVTLQTETADTDETEDSGNSSAQDETRDSLKVHVFTVVGEVTDPQNVDNPFGVVSYRADSVTAQPFFVLPGAVDTDVYTGIRLIVSGARKLQTFSQEYDDLVAEVQDRIISQVKTQRENARLEQVKSDAQTQLDQEKQQAYDQLSQAEQQLESARHQLEGWGIVTSAAGIQDAQKDAEQQLETQTEEYNRQKEETDRKFADAQKQIDDMAAPVWYIQTRSSLGGCSDIASDADSIEAIGTMFPVVFFLVAVLISLTTVTRMVEEDRGLIGTYKSLGYTDREIRRKFLIYCWAACGLGSAAGTLMAFFALPAFLFTIFRQMYLIPSYSFGFVPVSGVLGPVVFIAGISAAAGIACAGELRQVPAALMRPRAPRAGTRILLERIPSIWKKISFLNKVTARNLFRYKRRMLMTIFGIGGCMALLLFGFALKNSVSALRPKQYGQIFHYDMLAVASPGEEDTLLSYLSDDSGIESYLRADVTTATLKNAAGKETDVQVIVIEDGTDLSPYITLTDVQGKSCSLSEGDILITRNAGEVLGFGSGDKVSAQLGDLQSADLPVTGLVQNYLGNYVYMTRSTYETYFSDYTENGALVLLSESVKNPVSFADTFGEKSGILSCTSIQKLKDNFQDTFRLINLVVFIIIGMSAALAFVVLFTLSATNISERTREIATIKVLGFYDREVHAYVDKEVLILSAIGVVIGIPLGFAFAQTLTLVLRLPSISLSVTLHASSYGIAAVLSMAFAVFVNGIMNLSMDRIDPAEALKSVE